MAGAAHWEAFQRASRKRLMRIGQGLWRKIAEDARSACGAAPSLLENTAQIGSQMYQLGGSVGLRHAGTRIVTEEPSSTTAAVRTSRLCRAVIEHLVEWLIGRFR
jgi:hypothetical protein